MDWDEESARLLCDGDVGRWSVVIKFVENAVRRTGRSFRLTPSERDEVRGRTLHALWRNEFRLIRTLRNARGLPSLVQRIVSAEATTCARRALRLRLVDTGALDDRTKQAPIEQHRGTIDVLEYLQSKLSRAEYEVAYRKCILGESNREVAGKVGVRPDSVKRTFRRALSRLAGHDPPDSP